MYQAKVKLILSIIIVKGRVLQKKWIEGICNQIRNAGDEEKLSAYDKLEKLDCKSENANIYLKRLPIKVMDEKIISINEEAMKKHIVYYSDIFKKDISKMTGNEIEEKCLTKGFLCSFTPSVESIIFNVSNKVKFTCSLNINDEMNNKYILKTKESQDTECTIKHEGNATNNFLEWINENSQGFIWNSFPERNW